MNNNISATCFFILSLIAVSLQSCAQKNIKPTEQGKVKFETVKKENMEKGIDTATFGGGCFWCVEAIYQELNGVVSVTSGYSGGQRENPTYEQVCSGASGHAEVIQIGYDPSKISFDELLEVFWTVHDPTTLNRQGADVGTQYRSVVFYHNNEQNELTEKYKAALNASGAWSNPVVTEISPITKFYPAEKYHQEYYKNNANQSYCSFVIQPKVDKFRKVFKDKLKTK